MLTTEEVVEGVLEHHGVKGMRWGIRRKEVHPDIADVPKKTRKEAAKDAEEFTRAKLYFGEGAGTRRKLIKAVVETKRKKDPFYAKAFDHFVKQTDLAQRAHQARKQRKRTDTRKKAGRTFKRATNLLLEANAAQYSDIVDTGEEFLEHHGVLGMKWGVHRSNGSASGPSPRQQRKATKQLVKADAKFEKNARSLDTYIKINNAGAEHFNKHIGAINAKHSAAVDRGDLLDAHTAGYRAYHKEVSDMYRQGLEHGIAQYGGKNPSGTKEIAVRSPSPYTFEVYLKDVQHASGSLKFQVEPVKDAKGLVIAIKTKPHTISHSAMLIEDILEHHGVKGMKWGVSRNRSSSVTVTPSRVPGSKRLRSRGGFGHQPHPEAVRARQIGQIARKSGVHAVSDKDLQDYARRIQLEQNVKRLQFEDKSRGQKFVARLLGQGEKTASQEIAASATKQGKRAVKLAMAAVA